MFVTDPAALVGSSLVIGCALSVLDIATGTSPVSPLLHSLKGRIMSLFSHPDDAIDADQADVFARMSGDTLLLSDEDLASMYLVGDSEPDWSDDYADDDDAAFLAAFYADDADRIHAEW